METKEKEASESEIDHGEVIMVDWATFLAQACNSHVSEHYHVI